MRGHSILLALTLCLTLCACIQGDIEERDLPLLITIDDFTQYDVDLSSFADRQIFRRTRYFDGSLEIEYEFETPEDFEKPFYIAVTVGLERSTADALLTYKAEKGGVGIGASIGGVEMEEQEGFFEWGDESFFATLVTEKGPGGSVFGGRKGKKTYSIMIAGLYFDDAAEWEQFIQPKLDYLVSYHAR